MNMIDIAIYANLYVYTCEYSKQQRNSCVSGMQITSSTVNVK